MESHALTGLFPPIAYSFNGKPGPSPPKLAAHQPRGRLQPDARQPWVDLGRCFISTRLAVARARLAQPRPAARDVTLRLQLLSRRTCRSGARWGGDSRRHHQYIP